MRALKPPQSVLRLPGAVEHGLGAGDVIVRPIVDDGGQLGLRREALHVGGLAEAELAAGLGGLDRRRAVGVLGEHVDALVEQRLGGIGLPSRGHTRNWPTRP